jgi:hypothetical protein
MNKKSILFIVIDFFISLVAFGIGMKIFLEMNAEKSLHNKYVLMYSDIIVTLVLIIILNVYFIRQIKSMKHMENEIKVNENNDKNENSDKEKEDTEKDENVDENQEEIKEEKEIRKRRILINDDSWKEFKLPRALGNPFSDYSQIGSSFFIDVTNWDVHIMIKELEMFDSELKNDLYFKHKVDLFMKINDRDYRYPRVSQKEMLAPEEILSIQMNPVEIEKDTENDDNEKIENKDKQEG